MKDVKSDPRFSTTLLLAQTGDRQALEKVLRRIQKPLYYYILRITGEADTAEDLTQETLMQVVRKLKYLREPAALSTWVYRIATRIVVKQLKSKKHPEHHQDLDSIAELSDGGIDLLKRELELDFLKVTRHLSHDMRATLQLRVIEGHSLEEIAVILEIPTGTAKSRLSTSLKQVREALA